MPHPSDIRRFSSARDTRTLKVRCKYSDCEAILSAVHCLRILSSQLIIIMYHQLTRMASQYLLLVILLFSLPQSCKGPDTSLWREQELIDEGNLEAAQSRLKYYTEDMVQYPQAQIMLRTVDSLIVVRDSLAVIERQQKDSLAAIAAREQALKDIDAAILDLKEVGRYDTQYANKDGASLGAIVSEFERFGALVIRHRNSKDEVLRGMAGSLERELKRVQVREFPKIRRAYVEVLGKALWEDDIALSCQGAGCKYALFVGGKFAANANIKAFETTIAGESLDRMRFQESRYKWYDLQSEYQYYSRKVADSDIRSGNE